MSERKGAICNIPVSVSETFNFLPCPSGTSGLVLIKLKKKKIFNGHVYFESVSPANIENN